MFVTGADFLRVHVAPGPPASLSFESPSETSLILHWTPPVETNGILLGYVVQYQQGKCGAISFTANFANGIFLFSADTDTPVFLEDWSISTGYCHLLLVCVVVIRGGEQRQPPADGAH